MRIFSNIIRNSLLAITLMGSQAVQSATDDDYLKALEMEASDEVIDDPLTSEGFDSDTQPGLDAPATDAELIQDKKELIVDVKSFEKALKSLYPESYGLYEQLTDEQKKAIYQDFTQHKRIYNSSVKIISTYLDSH